MLSAGCATGPLTENPIAMSPALPMAENPVLIAPGEPGPHTYARVFETVLDVVDDHFTIPTGGSNRYDGRIVSSPRIAPGLVQFWKPGSPDPRERLLAILQTIRHRAVVQISAAPTGGYFVEVQVFKELMDAAAPSRVTSGVVAFQSESTVERQFQVIDPVVRQDPLWIPQGRDTCIEQMILDELRRRQ